MQLYKRIALVGAIANPNVGDEAILTSNLQLLQRMYGENCKIYVFTKDATYTALYSSEPRMQIIPVDYLHQLSSGSNFDIERLINIRQELSNYIEKDYTKYTAKANLIYQSLHAIFQEIDLLHIIGGGYLNSKWPDMIYEILMATDMAKKYNKKYFFTGLSIFPIMDKHKALINEIFEGAEIIDFRDDYYLEQLHCLPCTKLQVTVDDALFMNVDTPAFNSNNSPKYANILLHKWEGFTDVMVEKAKNTFIPFIKMCIENKIVESFNILLFSENDDEIWSSVRLQLDSEFKDHIYFLNFVNQHSTKAKRVVSEALFNIGTRFHLAIFSLSAAVPVLSIYSDDYYKNKIKVAHCYFNSDSFVDLQSLDENILKNFIKHLDSKKQALEKILPAVKEMYCKKMESIADVYSINTNDKEYLLGKLVGKIHEPKISVIIPIFNMDAYLPCCLDSVIAQTLTDIEIICINDGSTDYSQQILNECAWKDSRIKVLSHTNHGVAYSRNRGIDSAKGEFLYFLDPDDYLPDEKVLFDLYTAAKQNQVLICGGSFREVNGGHVIENWDGNLSKYTFEKDGLIEYKNYQFDYGWVRFIYDRKFLIYNDIKIPPYKFFEDPVFFVKAMHYAQKFYALKRCTYSYRTGHKSLTLSYEKVLDLIRGLSDNIAFAKKYGYTDLQDLEMARIEHDYAGFISQYLMGENNIELRKSLNTLNELLFDGNNCIEYRIYHTLLCNSQATIYNQEQQLYQLRQELQRKEHEFYNSTTWKVGNLVLLLPKKIKKLFNKL